MATPQQLAAQESVFAMIRFMKEREKAGGYSSDDVITLIRLWAKVGETVYHVRDKGKAYGAVVKKYLCQDYTAKPDDEVWRPDPNWPDEDPKASRELMKRLGDIANTIYDKEGEGWGYLAFNQAEGAMGRLVRTYEVRLSGDADGTKAFKQKLKQLRHGSL